MERHDIVRGGCTEVPAPTPVVVRAVDVGISLLIPAVLAYFVLDWLATDSCLDAGGRVLRGPVDQFCEFADGRKTPLTLGFSAAHWIGVALGYSAAAAGLFWLSRRLFRY